MYLWSFKLICIQYTYSIRIRVQSYKKIHIILFPGRINEKYLVILNTNSIIRTFSGVVPTV
jgi:hypothetical protein